MKRRGKKAVSPVVSTTMLIVIVVILTVIIYFWGKSFIGEKLEKFGKPIESVCPDVNLRASIEGNRLLLVNRGNVPIYAIGIKEISPGTSEIKEKIVDLDKGSSKNETISISSSATSVIIMPVLLGESGDQRKKFTCEEHSIEIEL
jgi:hypothetical protein